MTAETCGVCLLGAMDRLWFHQIILSSEQSLFLSPNTPKPITSESPNYSSNNSSQISVTSEQEVPSVVASVITGSQDETSSQESDDHDKGSTTEDEERERATRLNLVSRETRYHSSQKQESRKLGNSRFSRLKKSMSCKSLGELELEEVKGFMDLGFSFKKEKLSKQMMSLIPGLQRIDASYKTDEEEEDNDDDDDDDDDEKKGIMRPYLSEAWLIKRPDSPLLNMRIPRVSTTEDMKKHLKNWARTVASSIHQES